MVRATIELDDETFERFRRLAEARKTSVERLVAEAADRFASQFSPATPGMTLDEFFDSVSDITLDLGDWTWNRDELYDRQVLR